MNLWQRIRRFVKSLRHSMDRTKIRAVHEDDLFRLITSLGIEEDIRMGRYRCMCCNAPINMDNLWGILSREDKIHLICSDPECLAEIY